MLFLCLEIMGYVYLLFQSQVEKVPDKGPARPEFFVRKTSSTENIRLWPLMCLGGQALNEYEHWQPENPYLKKV
ncbi:hypothetical protein TWF102_004064 [Orbilia oligospora]|uniref:Uncharacterized protein n=1 Tax=Orbilia oligospora TaxID=2813651 RepID=A0A7C8JH58_ORBOL|nr:hypothetical protein TWF102_004064 [Orbilia oligospora]